MPAAMSCWDVPWPQSTIRDVVDHEQCRRVLATSPHPRAALGVEEDESRALGWLTEGTERRSTSHEEAAGGADQEPATTIAHVELRDLPTSRRDRASATRRPGRRGPGHTR